MTITVPRVRKPATVDEFIGNAPDASAEDRLPLSHQAERTFKAKRGVNRSQISVVLANDLINKIDERAAGAYMTRSAYITMALNKFIEEAG